MFRQVTSPLKTWPFLSRKIRQSETDLAVSEVCRKMGVSEATICNWKKKYGGLGLTEFRRLRQLEEENSLLKKVFADLSLDKHMLQEVSA